MVWLDIAIVVVWAAAGLWGFFSGVLGLVLPFIGMAFGLALGSRYGETLGNIFSGITDNEDAQRLTGFLIIVVVCSVAGGIIAFMARSLLSVIPVANMGNRLLGLVVGVILGFVLLSGIFTGLQRYPVKDVDIKIEDSKLAVFLADNFDVIIRGVRLIPSDWDDEPKGF